MCIERPSM